MHTAVKQAILEHARSHPTQEVCGFIVQSGPRALAWPAANVTRDDPSESFEIAPADYMAADQAGDIVGVYHGGMTHTNPGFSEADLITANELALPMHALSAGGELAVYVPSTYWVDPIGRQWCWGLSDCYEAIRTHYRNERKVYLSDHERDESFVAANHDAITKHIAGEGFAAADPNTLTKDDVLLFSTPGATHAHHLGVYLGSNRFFHHPLNMLSRIDDLNDHWFKRLVSVLRHQP